MSFAFVGTHIFRDKTLKLPLDLSKLIMNGYLSSAVFKSIWASLTMHDSSFRDRHLVAKYSLKLNNIELLNAEHYFILFFAFKY